MPEFIKFPKSKRLEAPLQITVTEKIDGTNGVIYIEGSDVYAGSRNRFITPEDDNFGFAKWVEENKVDLLSLGDGYHYGEWHGYKINRGYNLGKRKFSLFNVHRWRVNPDTPLCCDVVPLLYMGEYQGLEHLYGIWESLTMDGSRAGVDFMKPEGLMVFFHDFGKYLKMPMDK